MSKIKLGTPSIKSSKFGWDVDSSTTLKFGEVTPTVSLEVAPNTSGSVKVSSAVRLTPLVSPTFGSATLQHYAAFVDYAELFPWFDYMKAQRPYPGANYSYTPEYVPLHHPAFLTYCVLRKDCRARIFAADDGVHVSSTSEIYREQLAHVNSYDYDPGTGLLTIDPDEVRFTLNPDAFALEDIVYDTSLYRPTSGEYDLAANAIRSFFGAHPFASESEMVNIFTHLPIDGPESQYYTQSANNDTFDVPSADYFFPFGTTENGRRLYIGIRLGDNAKRLYKIFKGLGYQLPLTLGETASEYSVNQYLNYTQGVSLLPIFAFYRAYWDMFAPKREITWETSSLARLLRSMAATGYFIGSPAYWLESDYDASNNGVLFANFLNDLQLCFYTTNVDYYAAAITNQTVAASAGHIRTPDFIVNETELESRLTNRGSEDAGKAISCYLDGYPLVSMTSAPYNTATTGVNRGSNATLGSGNHRFNTPATGTGAGVAQWNDYTTQNVQQVKLDMLKALTRVLNVRTATGAKISKMMQALFGYTPALEDDHSYYIGSMRVPIEFSDIMNTTQSDEYSLGDFAGKAFGAGKDGFHFSAKHDGIFIVMTTVIPRTQYSQGINPNLYHTSHLNFYNPSYDGLTLVPIKRSSLYGQCTHWNGASSLAYDIRGNFGNLPIYSEYKTKTQGILNGDLSLPSRKSTYESFVMDRNFRSDYFPLNDPSLIDTNGGTSYSYCQFNLNNIVNGSSWQYLAAYQWLSDFDRIFVSQGNRSTPSYIFQGKVPDYDDTMINHNVIEYSLTMPMLAIGDTYKTKLDNADNDGVLVDKV